MGNVPIQSSNAKTAIAMKTYLEIKVPLYTDVTWYKSLLCSFRDVNTNWQNGYWHITTAFIDDTPFDVDVAAVIDKHLRGVKPMSIELDTLGVFATPSGKSKIIYITASNPTSSLLSLISDIREELSGVGCVMETEFRLHITLGRVFDENYDVPELQKILDQVEVKPFKVKLDEADYREFRGREIQNWYFTS